MTPITHIRNLAIVAHIDHGKTTLIDSVFRATRTFRENQQVAERLMDNNAIERERGITIRSKHCTVSWNDYLINIIDTPGHADFSGEVERVLSMVDSVLLLVDANEGPMPQTRYVLMRALRLGLRPIVILNKVDRPNARPDYALNKTFDLFIELGASDEQAHFPVLYGSGLDGWFVRNLEKDTRQGMDALFETIVAEVPPPQVDQDGPFLMQISSLDWSDYIGQIGCGRVLRGKTEQRGRIHPHHHPMERLFPPEIRLGGYRQLPDQRRALLGDAGTQSSRGRHHHRRRYRLACRSGGDNHRRHLLRDR